MMRLGEVLSYWSRKGFDWLEKTKEDPYVAHWEPVKVISKQKWAEYDDYIAKCYRTRNSSFAVTKKMRKYVPGEHVFGRRSNNMNLIEGYVLGSWRQAGGSGYFIMRKDTGRIIQIQYLEKA